MFNYKQRKINQQAREWFLRVSSHNATDDDFFEFNQWLEKPAHAAAYASIESLWHSLGELGKTKEGQLLLRHAHKKNTPVHSFLQTLTAPWFLGGSSVITLTIVCMVYFLHFESQPRLFYQTQTAETRTITLTDGSIVTLTPETSIDVHFHQKSRELTLQKGHAFVTVSKDTQRPLSVTHGHFKVTVKGTQFSVNTKISPLNVKVTEGRVIVEAKPPLPSSLQQKMRSILLAGDEIQAQSNNLLGNVIHSSINELDNWKNGILVYKDATIENILLEINSYAHVKIMSNSTVINNSRISLSININELEALPKMLEALLPIKAIKNDYGNIILIEDNKIKTPVTTPKVFNMDPQLNVDSQ